MRLNFLAQPITGGWAHFHHDGPEKVRGGVLKRDVGDWTPMFSVPTESSGQPLVFKVKAGWLSFDHYQSALSHGHFTQPLRAYAKPRAVTYIGDLWLAEKNGNVRYLATDEATAVEALRDRYPALVARYAPVTDLLRVNP